MLLSDGDVHFGSIADICGALAHVCFGPTADISGAQVEIVDPVVKHGGTYRVEPATIGSHVSACV